MSNDFVNGVFDDDGVCEMDLFSMLGIERSEKKKEPDQKAKPKAQKKSVAKVNQQFKSPFTIFSGCYEPFTITAEDGGELPLDYLKEKWHQEHPEYTQNLMDFSTDSDRGFASFHTYMSKAKGSVKLDNEFKLLYAGHIYDLSTIMTDTECEIDINEIKKLVYTETPEFGANCSFYVDEKEKIIVPRPGFTPVAKEKDFCSSLNICVIGRDVLALSQEKYLEFANENGVNVKISEKGSFTAEESLIQKYVISRYPEFQNRMEIGYFKESKGYSVIMTTVEGIKSAKTEEKFPTEDMTISLLFTQIPISPAMFGGKTEVSEAEIIKFVCREHPEYSKDRTKVEYDKKNKLLIMILKGSKKGALISAEEQDAHEAREYFLEIKEDQGEIIRFERLPFCQFYVAEDPSVGKCDYFLPKIPRHIFRIAETFFCFISQKYNSEAMLQVFWNKDEREYELYCPKQICSYAQLSSERNSKKERENWLIMDLHSHGKICCTFSQIDDADEIEPRLYGVFYDFGDFKRPKFDLRASCGGHFIRMEVQDLFEYHSYVTETRYAMNFSKWESNITII